MSTGDVGLIDAHTHLHDERLQSCRDEIVEALREENVTWWGVNGTSPTDWREVAKLADVCSEVYPFFGVHPWKVGTLDESWEDNLIELLLQFPRSGVGEIGLDRWIRGYDLPRQKEVFARQLELALSYQRPIAIHCLQAWGHLSEILEDQNGNRPFLLHSYSGPVEMVSKFLDQGAFFSISGYFFREEKQQKLNLFREIPRDRILLETDAPDMLPPSTMRRFQLSPTSEQDRVELNHPANLSAIYEAYAAWSDRTKDEIIRELADNCHRWIAESVNPGS